MSVLTAIHPVAMSNCSQLVAGLCLPGEPA
jgi:hypothetical protein